MDTVVIVESPAKAKTINKYLGNNFQVVASYGHVRDLPSKDGSVEPDNAFAMHWESDGRSSKQVNEIAKLVKQADRLVLATDPDREGEAISWHILEILNQKKILGDKKIDRVAFNEITKRAVQDAMAQPRSIDQQLVNAYLARRALDYLVGFTLSPVLWRKLPGSRSAGRVQSVALRLICEREEEIDLFKPQEYWSVTADAINPKGDAFQANLTHVFGEKLKKFDLGNEAQATKAVEAVKAGTFKVATVTKKQVNRHPSPPFTTSTLQQEASRKLGFGATRTMRTAQSLYEGISIGGETVGLITYMRTDGVQLAQDAIQGIRDLIGKDFGNKYVPGQPKYYKSKAKNTQEAHEAIRPTDVFRHPKEVARYLNDDQKRLYELIWKRTVACQMESATLDQVTADISDQIGTITLRATGSVIAFDGFIKVYTEGRDDSDSDDDKNNILPPLKQGDVIDLKKVIPEQHFTKPPPRYTEASLVKKMEELGIGRPSTYASIMQVLQDRNYVRLESKRFIPEDRGKVVTAFLASFFTRYVEYDFTARMEEALDRISAGEVEWKDILNEFWKNFKAAVDETKDLRISEVLDALNDILGHYYFPKDENGAVTRTCPSCKIGELSIKLGKMGAFIGCDRYPDCNYTRPLTVLEDGAEAGDEVQFPKELGAHPESGDMITLRLGPYGPYVQLGEEREDGSKPKRATLPRNLAPKDVTLDQAVELLRLPRDVGKHPETGNMIVANTGRFGPYIAHDGVFVSLKEEEELFTIGINRAVDLIAEKLKKMERKEIGAHPKTKKPIYTQKSRFGYQIVSGTKKVNLPKSTKPETITLDKALELLSTKKKKSSKKSTKKSAKKKKSA